MSLKDKLNPAAQKLQPLREKLQALPQKLKAEGLKGYAIRTAVMNVSCLAVAVLVCHFLLSMGAKNSRNTLQRTAKASRNS